MSSTPGWSTDKRFPPHGHVVPSLENTRVGIIQSQIAVYRVTGGRLIVAKIVEEAATDGSRLGEIAVHRRLKHPSILPLIGHAPHPELGSGLRYLITPFAKGLSLHCLILAAANGGHAIPDSFFFHVIETVLEGIRYLQRSVGLVHGDMRPANIVLVPHETVARRHWFPRVQIMDFGSIERDASRGKTNASVRRFADNLHAELTNCGFDLVESHGQGSNLGSLLRRMREQPRDTPCATIWDNQKAGLYERARAGAYGKRLDAWTTLYFERRMQSADRDWIGPEYDVYQAEADRCHEA